MYTYVILVGFIGFIDKIWRVNWGFIVDLGKGGKIIYDIVLHDNSFQSTKNLTPKSKVKFFISYHEFHLTSLTRCLTICCIKDYCNYEIHSTHVYFLSANQPASSSRSSSDTCF